MRALGHRPDRSIIWMIWIEPGMGDQVITMVPRRHEGFEVTLDLLGGAYLVASVQAAARRGRIMLIGTIAGRTATVPLGMILVKRLLLRGTVLRARSIEEKRAATAAFARDVLPLLASGTVRPTVDRVFELDEIRAAHERLASNETFGKVVLRM
jgi:NADPH:quinone reductase-like Zn-dependent oxidoreductase